MMSEDDAKKFGSFVFVHSCFCPYVPALMSLTQSGYTHATPEMGEVGAVKGERQLKFGAVSLSVLL